MNHVTVAEPDAGASERIGSGLFGATLCGSFRRDVDGLRAAYDDLRVAGCRVLSPASLDFIAEDRGFVLTEDELELDPTDIEGRHLRAMQEADFVWLHAPNGYVGTSAAMELGFARGLRLPVFCSEMPEDVTIAGIVRVVASVQEALRILRGESDAPADGIVALQHYYRRVAADRGWDREPVEECLRLLRTEVNELDLALRTVPDRQQFSAQYDSNGVGAELADIQLYLVHLANIVRVDLGDAVVLKERYNAARFGARAEAAA